MPTFAPSKRKKVQRLVKLTCLQAVHCPDRYGIQSSSENAGAAHSHIPTPHHVIDYYIYTLEHILI